MSQTASPAQPPARVYLKRGLGWFGSHAMLVLEAEHVTLNRLHYPLFGGKPKLGYLLQRIPIKYITQCQVEDDGRRCFLTFQSGKYPPQKWEVQRDHMLELMVIDLTLKEALRQPYYQELATAYQRQAEQEPTSFNQTVAAQEPAHLAFLEEARKRYPQLLATPCLAFRPLGRQLDPPPAATAASSIEEAMVIHLETVPRVRRVAGSTELYEEMWVYQISSAGQITRWQSAPLPLSVGVHLRMEYAHDTAGQRHLINCHVASPQT